MDTQTMTIKQTARGAVTPEGAAFRRVVARLRANIPPDMTPEGIEREIAEAQREVREERHARGR